MSVDVLTETSIVYACLYTRDLNSVCVPIHTLCAYVKSEHVK